MKTINERIEFIIQEKKMNYSSFGLSIGSTGQVIRSICTNRNKPSCDIIQAIIENYPEYDPLWFTIGLGEFYKHDTGAEKDLVQILKRENEILIKNNDSLLKDKERLWGMLEKEDLGKLEADKPTQREIYKLIDRKRMVFEVA